ncbi:MAG TPA: histone deacetylase, partial [Myxococcota bacterium]|nr:histone deacetylase [Myxococcota bacterium]
MLAKRRMAVVDDPRFAEHRAPIGHPERAERVAAVAAAIAARSEPIARIAPRAATPDEIALVHSREHVDRIAEAVKHAPARLDVDTFVSPRSLEVALLAAGGAIELALAIARGEITCGLAALRPPGHHAETDRAMGFCLFNNVAIAARALQRAARVERILILDWDVHHGNGTQHFFETDASVLYASIHQFPLYPGTGAVGEIGTGRGEGFTLNVPLPAGCGDREYVGVMLNLIEPAARRFKPEMLLVSCGFDAHRDDPLADMNVTRDGFRDMAAIARAIADDLCAGRIAFVLEGGYA